MGLESLVSSELNQTQKGKYHEFLPHAESTFSSVCSKAIKAQEELLGTGKRTVGGVRVGKESHNRLELQPQWSDALFW